MSGKPWTDEERRRLRAAYRRVPAAALAGELCRSRRAIYQEAVKLGCSEERRDYSAQHSKKEWGQIDMLVVKKGAAGDAAWGEIRPVLVKRLFRWAGQSQIPRYEMDRAAALTKFDEKAAWKKAEAEIPTPKSLLGKNKGK